MCEKITMYLSLPADSHKMAETTILKQLKDNCLCANIFPYSCTVKNKNTQKISIENGFKVDIFINTNNDYNTVFHTWIRLRTLLCLNCAWVETTKYQGCITRWNTFKHFCEKNSYLRGKCSKYE